MPGPEVARACENVPVCDGSGAFSILEARLAQEAGGGGVREESKRHRACFDASAPGEPHPHPCECHSLKCLAYALASERRL